MNFNQALIDDYKMALKKAANYCAYQERCHWELEQKFKEWNVAKDIRQQVSAELIQQNFLNEERFAKAFVHGKVNIKKWGRNKIKMALEFRQISSYLINFALQEIDEKKYILNLQKILNKKAQTIDSQDEYQIKMTLLKFLTSKGYEAEIVNEQIEKNGITR